MGAPMNPAKKPPAPIFDNLKYIGNPFKKCTFDSRPYFDSEISGADIDLEHGLKFLYSYKESEATYNSYRRELERLFQWSWKVKGESVLRLRREDIVDYINFAESPFKTWIGTSNVSRFKNRNGARISNPGWRPFVATVSKSDAKDGIDVDPKHYSISQATKKSILTGLGSFYDYLFYEGLVESNPVHAIRQKRAIIQTKSEKAQVRRISNEQWRYVLAAAEKLASSDPAVHERTLFMLKMLYIIYLRISELVSDRLWSPTMSDFYTKSTEDGLEWWFKTVGKGNKERNIPVPDTLLCALSRYRQHLGLSPLPTYQDRSPLMPLLRGTGPITSTRQIRSCVQECFDLAYDDMTRDGYGDTETMALKQATVHWLRHTGISEDIKGRPANHVQADAGHVSFNTTARYNDADDRERHASAKKSKRE